MRLDVDRFTYLHPQLMTLAELGHYIRNLMQISEFYLKRLLKYRRERPVYFCSFICSILSVTAYIGNKISGFNLLFFSATAIVSAPGIYLHLLPEPVKIWMKQNIGLKLIKNMNELSHHHHEQEEEYEQRVECPVEPLISILKKSPETIRQEASQSLSSLTSTAAKTIETQALSILEHFKMKTTGSSRNSSTQLDEKVATSSSCSRDGDELTSNQQTAKVSVVDSKQQHTESSSGSSRSHQEEPKRKNSDDISSNESVSLIDSDNDDDDDDDGEGGFVML